MISAEDNRLLTSVGPGTPMGEVMRRYWVPVGLSAGSTPPTHSVQSWERWG